MIAPIPRQENEQILAEAQNAIETRLYQLSGRLRCEFREGWLFLSGRVSSYYQKQVAQEAVRGLDAVDGIVNEIEVVPA